MSFGPWQIILVVLLIVLLFGRGKISGLMGDVAKGIKSFKKGMAEDDDTPKELDHTPAETPADKDKTAKS
jgi:sec-independent protein translocase protein TatA